jgi:type IV pilus assembly protein PilM
MSAQPTGVWGIDLGQCGLKAIRLQEIDGQIVATAFDYVEHPKILSQPDADPDQLTREALEKFLSRNNLRGDIVAISVPGQSGLARFVKLPPVEEKKIADIVRFEAKQQIPFNLDEVVWDYQKIGSGVVTDGFAMETEIGLFAMKRDMVGRYLQHFKDVGVDIHLVQMAPLALCNYVAFDLLSKDAAGGEESGDKRCVVALDIGADSSNLVITDGERIIWQRPIPLGGNHFTRALTKDLKLTFAKAEHVKRNATKSPDLKKILAALKPVLNDFVGEVQRSLGYFTNTHRDAHIEYMIGLGNAFRLPGLQKFLSEKLQLEVRKLVKMERISGDQVTAQQVYSENVLTFAVAYGLALQGLKRARLLTNLLPNEIRVERLVKAKKPYAIAAAAALLLGCSGLALSYALEYRTYGDSRVVEAEKKSEGVVKKAGDAKRQFDEAKKKARNEEEAVRTIVAGQFERDNWLSLFKFVNTAVPQPDGKEHKYPIPADDGSVADTIKMDNIPKTAQEQYGVPGAAAWEEYRKQRLNAGDKGGGASEQFPGIENLIQFNIESVQGFYCDNLSAYWTEVKGTKGRPAGGKNLVRPVDQFDKNPEGSGWIIEIHGWTYHHRKQSFVIDTLLENIARLGIREKKAEAVPPGGAPNPPGAPVGAPPRGTPPVPGQPANAQADQSDKAENLDPVINRISHVVLYKFTESDADGQFELLTPSTHKEVRDLASAQPIAADSGGSGGTPGMPPMPGMPGGGGPGGMPAGGPAMGPSSPGGRGGPGGPGMPGGGGGEPSAPPTTRPRSEWTGLGESGSDAGGGRPGFPQMGADRRGGPRPPMPGGGGMPPAGGRLPAGPGGRGAPMPGVQPGQMQGGAPAEKPEGQNKNGLKRTEFVILFVWKEPTDSDDLRGLKQGGSGGNAAVGAGGSNSPSAPPKRSRRPRGGNRGGGGGRNRSKGG